MSDENYIRNIASERALDEDERERFEFQKDTSSEYVTNVVGHVVKGRRYIDDPSEAPEGAEVHEGEQGGTYYETEDGDSSDPSGEPAGPPSESGSGDVPVNDPDAVETWNRVVEQYGSPETLGETVSGDPDRAESLAREAIQEYSPENISYEAFEEVEREYIEDARQAAIEEGTPSDRMRSQIVDEMDDGPVTLDTDNGEYAVDVGHIEQATGESDFIVWGENENGDHVGIPSSDIHDVAGGEGGYGAGTHGEDDPGHGGGQPGGNWRQFDPESDEEPPGAGGGDDGGRAGPEELWESQLVDYENLSDDELNGYAEYLWDLHDEAHDEYEETGSEEADERMRDVMSELREVDREQLSRDD